MLEEQTKLRNLPRGDNNKKVSVHRRFKSQTAQCTNRVEVFAGQRCWNVFYKNSACTKEQVEEEELPCTEHVGAARWIFNIILHTHSIPEGPLCPLNRLASPHLCALHMASWYMPEEHKDARAQWEKCEFLAGCVQTSDAVNEIFSGPRERQRRRAALRHSAPTPDTD